MLIMNIVIFTILFVLLTRKIMKLQIAKTDPTKVNWFLRKLINKKEELQW